jgi:hypothetical protein
MTNNLEKFALNMIVKGKVAGTFVILTFKIIDGEYCAVLKRVNDEDYTQVARGELTLPLDCLEVLA